ncbi:LANO_0G18184g1_1 [Lachancea nothofagi CBS 11611]|uniref:LANO_0G18184g1_1 n=1 Tax=Lachancea nothofagi CBS 11611 TaxID=1266666 RepID=A0A1G4KKU1_9SACH|nr:LANO_0G18184g1_1 [Lachancea nothofagi CBS 11611]
MSLEAVQSCIQWAKTNGGSIDERIEFKLDQSTGLHAITKSAIKDSKALITIPKELLIVGGLAETHFGIKNPSQQNPNALLQLYVAKLKFGDACQEAVFYKPYLDLLPNTEDISTPYFWTSEELSALKGTDLLIKTERNLKKLVGEWFDVIAKVDAADENDTQFYLQSSSSPNFNVSDHIQHAESLSWHSFSAYLWSTYIFSSRAFPELIFNDKSLENVNQAFLFPIVDLLNHANGKKVKWHCVPPENALTFSTDEKLAAGDEVCNNYGDKSNEELLLGYGFAIPDNDFDTATLTLRLPPGQIESFQVSGLKLEDMNLTENSVNFTLNMATPLPAELIEAFGILSKLTSEQSVTTRSILEGTAQLNEIINQKLAFFKKASKLKVSLGNPIKSQSCKAYLSGQKKIYQEASDFIKKYQRKQVKDTKPWSFKNTFKADKSFVNSLTLTFGVTKYEDLLTKGFLQQALLLWIVRVSNGGVESSVPKFLEDCIKDVAATIVVEKEDVQEFLPFYKSMFPQLSTKIPEIYGKGDWGIKKFIIAGTVIDRLVWTLPTSQEAFFFERQPFK